MKGVKNNRKTNINIKIISGIIAISNKTYPIFDKMHEFLSFLCNKKLLKLLTMRIRNNIPYKAFG